MVFTTLDKSCKEQTKQVMDFKYARKLSAQVMLCHMQSGCKRTVKDGLSETS